MEAPVGDTNTLKQINGMAKPTKTTNPLHFEDLEAHRFEDLGMDVLKKMYQWKRLDPIGVMGSDDGIDLFGVDVKGVPYYCQIKRYQKITPQDIRDIIIKIATGNEIGTNARLILIVACNPSKKAFDAFYEEAEKHGFQDPTILTGKKLESDLYSYYPDLLEQYFGIGKKTKNVSKAALIRKNMKLKKLAEQKLIVENVTELPISVRIREPWRCFIDNALMLLSSKASLSSDRYGNEGSWMKVCPWDMSEGGIKCYLMLYRHVVFNMSTHCWHLKAKDEKLQENEVELLCHVMGILPYYQIVEIEEYDSYFRYSVIHCEAEDIMDAFSKLIYDFEDIGRGTIIFDECNPLDDYQINELVEYIKTTHN